MYTDVDVAVITIVVDIFASCEAEWYQATPTPAPGTGKMELYEASLLTIRGWCVLVSTLVYISHTHIGS